jgi:hypothetical protein
MARVLDAQAAVPQVDIAVEPDSSACMTQTAIDPTGVFGPDVEVSTGDFCVLHNTLVYASPKAYAATKVATVHAKTHGDYTRLLPITGSYRANQDLSVVGVAYDGVESAEMAQMYPDARGRVVVQITGTATVVMHPLDLDELCVGDLLCLTGEAYDGGLVGNPSVKLPKIAKYARDPFVTAVRLLISRAQNGGVHAPTSALALAAAIFSMHRHRFSAMWNRCTDMLATYHSDLPLKRFADDTDTLAEFVRSAKEEIDNAVDAGMLAPEAVAIARVIASLNLTVFDLDKLHQWMQDPPPTVEAFVENLRRHCPANPPFALLLERGHSQARILLQPGAVV